MLSATSRPTFSEIDWRSLSVEEADRLAWRAVCEWPQAAGVDPIIDGIDYSQMTRLWLRDKVARAIQQLRDSEGFAFEKKLLDQYDQRARAPRAATRRIWPLILSRRLFNSLSWNMRRCFATTSYWWLKRRVAVWVPLAYQRGQRTLDCLARLPYRSGLAGNTCVGLDYGSPAKATKRFGDSLAVTIDDGLQKFGVRLLDADKLILKNELAWCKKAVDRATVQLRELRPRLLFTFSDSDPPNMQYVFAAHRLGIPSLVIPHGLDCERYVLDEAYASCIALWGEERGERFRRLSTRRPHRMQVTGNPEYDHLRRPERILTTGDYLLWVTRPHTPLKCCLPSRRPLEGLKIFDALISVLRQLRKCRLVIKPHPADYAEIYKQRALLSDMSDRVEISNQPLQELLPKSRIVLSEDSTAGLEAMFFGKPLIHVHFAQSQPVMPFVEYGAAVPAWHAEMLLDAIQGLLEMDLPKQRRMIDGQREFLLAFNGPCDGRAAERLQGYVQSMLSGPAPRRSQK